MFFVSNYLYKMLQNRPVKASLAAAATCVIFSLLQLRIINRIGVAAFGSDGALAAKFSSLRL